MSIHDDEELLAIFLEESREHLADIEANLLEMEQAGDAVDDELVNRVFRAAHSIKGGSGFFALTNIQELAHKIENVLDAIRSRRMTPTPDIINILLISFDRLRELLNNIAESNAQDIDEFVNALVALLSSHLTPDEKVTLAQTKTITHPDGHPVMVVPLFDYEQAAKTKNIFLLDYDMIHDIHHQGKTPADVFKELINCGEVLECVIDLQAVGSLDDEAPSHLPFMVLYATVMDLMIMRTFGLPDDRLHLLHDRDNPAPVAGGREATSAVSAEPEHVTVAGAVPTPIPSLAIAPEPVSPPVAKPSTSPAPVASTPVSTSATSSAAAETTLRVNIGLLETLMNLAGELVLSRNQLRASIAQHNTQALHEADQRINQVTSELQDAIMQTRLQPIGTVLSKFPRIIRDMSDKNGKDIALEIVGKEVALDKSLIEGLSDPLTHMVRNAVDHGIESPQARERAGKGRQGQIRIEARHEAGQVLVEIADDGGGIDPDRVAQSAISKGLISSEKVQGLSTQEKIALIMLPGLSTKEQVSDISGRGVGMDVVKTNIDRLGGKVEIASELGKGTTFRIKLPLTLTIIPSLIFSLGAERFAIPQTNVVELLRIHASSLISRIERVGEAEVLILRDELIPIARFDTLLGLCDEVSCSERDLEIAVVTTGVQTYALVVGAFEDTEEIVVKPLGRHLQVLGEYAGATVLGDGTIALILDVTGLAHKALLAGDAALANARKARTEYERASDLHSLLLFHNAPHELCALPLDMVLRIEHVTPEQIETFGGRRTMQYRGGALPLVTLADAATVESIGAQQDLAVLVSSIRGREIGLLGAMPVDVIDIQTEIDQQTHRQRGIAGSTIIHGQTALLVDLLELVEGEVAPPPVYVPADPLNAVPNAPSGGGTVLLAEDSDFFRTQVQRYLEGDGLTVLAAPDGQAAWELLLDHAGEVTVVVTDIEMPRLDGLGLTKRIRADQRLAHLPIIALTSLAGDDEVARGLAAGVTSYQVKLDRDRLLEQVHQLRAEDMVSP